MKLMLSSQMLNEKEILRNLDIAWAVVSIVMPHVNDKNHGGAVLKGRTLITVMHLRFQKEIFLKLLRHRCLVSPAVLLSSPHLKILSYFHGRHLRDLFRNNLRHYGGLCNTERRPNVAGEFSRLRYRDGDILSA